ncbi:TraM recognition domain-containing protein [Corynebacterium phoceense]|uniref:type IV secretory system conjugative DNA transfer family protein n=1 Tax=Corynebacterium phoceense TaxID=1686286 RepID=UPI00211BA845|nr:type IV secretory system conjugative DNA transfer family protein [Corynebacterium phoceense]MCQ9334908.1 TraM recognition domain-containing protein [Corynebacterium phoceense]
MAGKDQARNLRQPGNDTGMYVIAGILGAFVTVAWAAQFCVLVANKINGTPRSLTWNPTTIMLHIAQGKLQWGGTQTVVALMLAFIVLLILFLWLSGGKKSKKGQRTRVDSATKHLASKKDISTLSKKAVASSAERLYTKEFAEAHPGLRIGHEVSTGIGLYGGWEDLHLVMAGPRVGKTTSSVIPAIVEAPGPVVTTSNKPDIVTDTIALTSQRGTPWVFDPQGITTIDTQHWYYDPLSYIRADENNMDAAAAALAGIFAAPYMRDNGGDNYFPSSARNLLTGLMLIAAIQQRPISDVLLWASDARNTEPVELLAQYPKWSFWKKTLQSLYNLTEKTRDGVFGQAQNMVSVFARAEVQRWVESGHGGQEFVPEDFVRSQGDTLYLLSKEGPRSVGIITTILTVAVMEAAESYGQQQENGRLPVPMVCPLDETANTVLWQELPNVVSHYGSRGIILMTYLQSYSQGINLWGKEKMEALWSATTIKCIGGGIDDDELTKRLSELIGVHEEYQRSSSHTSGSPAQISRSIREKQTLTPAEIASLPKGRWIVRAVGRRPMLAAAEPFWERDWNQGTTALIGKK